MTDFNIPDFLRLIGKGPEERPEWWSENYFVRDGCIPMCPREFICIAPFADILTDWTHDKDALLLGVALEWLRSREDDHLTIEFQLIEYFNECCWENTLVWINDRPGLTLARAIWAAMKGGRSDRPTHRPIPNHADYYLPDLRLAIQPDKRSAGNMPHVRASQAQASA